jgi:hypothetical protein
MNVDILVAIVTGLIGITSGALLTYISAILKFRKDLEAEYDKELRKARIDVYTVLWCDLQALARYDRPEPLNLQTLQKLTISMRKWYFEKGGLYLSEDSRKFYFDLKEIIKKILEKPEYQAGESLNTEDSEHILKQASLLRSQLTKDIGTRKSSPIADS